MSDSYGQFSHLFTRQEWERSIELSLNRPHSLPQAIEFAQYRVRIFEQPFIIFRTTNDTYRNCPANEIANICEYSPEYTEAAIVLRDQRAYIFDDAPPEQPSVPLRTAVTEPMPTPVKRTRKPRTPKVGA